MASRMASSNNGNGSRLVVERRPLREQSAPGTRAPARGTTAEREKKRFHVQDDFLGSLPSSGWRRAIRPAAVASAAIVLTLSFTQPESRSAQSLASAGSSLQPFKLQLADDPIPGGYAPIPGGYAQTAPPAAEAESQQGGGRNSSGSAPERLLEHQRHAAQKVPGLLETPGAAEASMLAGLRADASSSSLAAEESQEGGERALRESRGSATRRRTSVAVREEEKKTAAVKASYVTEAPRVVYLPKPTYPTTAVADEKEGYVLLKLLVAPTGTVEKFEILASEPPGVFDTAVTDVLPLWRFAPARDSSGKPVEFWKEYRYVFKLDR